MSLPMEVHAAIKKAFRSADERKKATLDAETLITHYRLAPDQWNEKTFDLMAKEKGWAPSTRNHRWYIFSRVLAVLHSSSTPTQATRGVESPDRFVLRPVAVRAVVRAHEPNAELGFISEDDVKRAVQSYLIENGWHCEVKWGQEHGIDIEAVRGESCWIIEVKGQGSRSEMRVNYFIGMLGETLQRMNDPRARYSIALPDIQQFRRLWERLPGLAKARTGITALFVDSSGKVTETP